MKQMSTEAMREANAGVKAVAYCWTCKEAGIEGWRSNLDGTFGLTTKTAKNNALKTLDLHESGNTNGHNVTYIIL